MFHSPLNTVKSSSSKTLLLLGCVGFAAASLAAVSLTPIATAADTAVPADNFDLSHWNITLPQDRNRDGKVDTVTVKKIQKYSHPDFFYLNDDGHMVFAAPNKAATTANSSNTRSELRYMLRGSNTKLKTSGAQNNFTLAVNPNADKYGSIGGRMDATLKVDHVSTEAGNPEKASAFSAVVGQIHAVKYKDTSLSLIHI